MRHSVGAEGPGLQTVTAQERAEKMTVRYIPELALLASVPCATESEMLRYPHSSQAVQVGIAGINNLGGQVRDTLDAIA